MSDEKRLLTAREAAALSRRLSESTLRRAIAGGDVPADCFVTLNRRLYIRRAAFERFLDGGNDGEQPAARPDALRAVEGGRR